MVRSQPALETSEQIEQVARVCHETIRAYSRTLGDTSLLGWENAPEYQKESSRSGVRTYFEQYAAGIDPSPRAMHEAWLAERKAGGWKHGKTKNHETKEHPSFVPYEDLPIQERMKDYLFAAVCKAFCAAVSREVRHQPASK